MAKQDLVRKGAVMTVAFELDGTTIRRVKRRASLQIHRGNIVCRELRDQEEMDELWEKLSEGGEKVECGWLKDKYGLSWQIVPTVLSEMLQDKDAEKSAKSDEGDAPNEETRHSRLEQAYRQR